MREGKAGGEEARSGTDGSGVGSDIGNSVRWVRSVAKWGRIMYVRKLTVELLLGSALIAKTGRAIKIRGLLALRLWGER